MKSKIMSHLIFLTLFILLVGCQSSTEPSVFLTEEERTWLKAYEGKIAIGYTTDYPPVEFLEYGKYTGISADFFELLEKKLGIDIQMVEFGSWSELMRSAMNKEIAGITAATKTDERSEYLNFTVPYIINPNVIITRKNFSEELTFDKLSNMSLKILVIEDYSIIEYLRENYPQLDFDTVANTELGIRRVSLGEADALIVEVMSAASSIQQDGISNLIVNTETPYDSSLSIASRNDWPMLNSIFNKGLAQITQSEKREIFSKYTPLEQRGLFNQKWFGTAAVIVLAILFLTIGVVVLWNRTLKRVVATKTELLMQQNQKLSQIQQQLEHEIEVRKASEAFIKYKSFHDELTGVYNRTFYNEEVKLLEKDQTIPLSIIIADLNGLKITNDTFGHLEGDKLIFEVAQILKNSVRSNDIVARIGGDEFAILLPYSKMEIAERICDAIKKECSRVKRLPVGLSVALGYATRESLGQSIDSIFQQAEDLMYKNKAREKGNTYAEIIESFSHMLEESRFESKAHTLRVKSMAKTFGEHLNFSPQEIEALTTLAEFHDLGVIAISEKILQKPEPLNSEEWEQIKRHPEIGYKIACAFPNLKGVAEEIFSHHERWDGKGYPRGIKGQDIPIFSRILNLLDTYDGITNSRPYRSAKSHEEALKEIGLCSGTQFDPELVEAFMDMWALRAG